jgi:hypothetical protein
MAGTGIEGFPDRNRASLSLPDIGIALHWHTGMEMICAICMKLPTHRLPSVCKQLSVGSWAWRTMKALRFQVNCLKADDA